MEPDLLCDALGLGFGLASTHVPLSLPPGPPIPELWAGDREPANAVPQAEFVRQEPAELHHRPTTRGPLRWQSLTTPTQRLPHLSGGPHRGSQEPAGLAGQVSVCPSALPFVHCPLSHLVSAIRRITFLANCTVCMFDEMERLISFLVLLVYCPFDSFCQLY